MNHSTVARRLAFWKPAIGVGAAAAASLLLAAGASAAVVTVAPDSQGSDHIAAAIAGLGAGPNTLVLQPGRYTSNSPLSISSSISPLTITVNHAAQASLGTGTPSTDYDTSQSSGANPTTPWMTLATGATVTLEGLNIDLPGGSSAPGFQLPSGSTLNLYDTSLVSPPFEAALLTGATLNMVDSLIYQPGVNGIVANASSTVNVTNSDIVLAGSTNILASGSTIHLTNSVVSQPGVKNCSITGGTTTTDAVLTDDTSCPAGTNNQENNSTLTNLENNPPSESPYNGSNVYPLVANGGPELTVQLPDASVGADADGGVIYPGDSSKCPLTDARFFVNTGGGCDIGQITNTESSGQSAAMETTAQGPVCNVETISTNGSGQKFEIVDATVGASGFGPSSGNGTYLQGGTSPSVALLAATVGFNTTSDINPADPITNEYEQNGSISILNPLSAPGVPAFISPVTSKPALQVEAVKQNQSLVTTWGFTTTDWAGQSAECF